MNKMFSLFRHAARKSFFCFYILRKVLFKISIPIAQET